MPAGRLQPYAIFIGPGQDGIRLLNWDWWNTYADQVLRVVGLFSPTHLHLSRLNRLHSASQFRNFSRSWGAKGPIHFRAGLIPCHLRPGPPAPCAVMIRGLQFVENPFLVPSLHWVWCYQASIPLAQISRHSNFGPVGEKASHVRLIPLPNSFLVFVSGLGFSR
jgi:hypothetical protein